MQKLISIPLLILYLAVSIGIQGVNHFCQGDLVSMALYGETKDADCGEMNCCDLPISEEKDQCCTDVQFVVLYESERSLALASNSEELKPSIQTVVPFSNLLMDDQVEWQPTLDRSVDPTSPTDVPIYLRNQSLIFYG